MRRPARRRDAGALHVLEAVIVVTMMLASVVFVVSLEPPAPGASRQHDSVQRSATDALAILSEMPIASPLGDDVLSVAVQECLQENCTRLTRHLDKLFPAGARYAVYLSTKEGTFAVHAPRQPPGEAVSARRTFEPTWSYQFLGVSQSAYDPAEDPLVVTGLPVFSGSPVHQGSSALRIQVEGNRSDHARYVMTAAASTRAVDSDDTPLPAATSVYFHAGNGTPLATRDVRAITVSGLGIPTHAPVALHVRVEETGGGVVPAGTRLSVEVPRGWTAKALPQADWTWLSDATDRNGSANGSRVLVRLERALSEGHADLALQATYHGDAPDHYAFVATLSTGAYAQAQTLVRADRHAILPLFEVPSVLVSAPRPMGVGATTTWTLAAFSPEPITVTRIVVAEEDARKIFGGIAPLAGPGNWTHTGDTLVWSGVAVIHQDAPLGLTFRVTSSSLGGPPTDRAAFTPTVAFVEHTGRLLDQTSPGLHRGVFLPAGQGYAGYNGTTPGAVRTTHPFASSSVHRTTALPGLSQYAVSDVAGLKDSVFGSAVTPVARSVEPGGTARLQVDLQSTTYELASLGFSPSIDVHVYPPWTGDARIPIRSIAVYNGTLAKGSGSFLSLIDVDGDLLPDPTSVGRHVVDVHIPEGWLYGPYVIEARVSWFERVATLVDGSPVTVDLVRSASVYDHVLVRPVGADVPATPLYDVHLLAWLEDWR